MIEPMDVIGKPREMVVLMSNGDKVVMVADSAMQAATVARNYMGDTADVMGVFDGTAMYVIEWAEEE